MLNLRENEVFSLSEGKALPIDASCDALRDYLFIDRKANFIHR